MPSYCPQCHELNESHVELCGKCGTPLEAEPEGAAESSAVEHAPQGSPWIIDDSLAPTEGKEKCPKCGSPYVHEERVGTSLADIIATFFVPSHTDRGRKIMKCSTCGH